MLKRIASVLLIISILLLCTSCNRYTQPDVVRERFQTLTPSNKVGFYTNSCFYINGEMISSEYLISCLTDIDDVDVEFALAYKSKIYVLADRRIDKTTKRYYVIEYDYIDRTVPKKVLEKDVARTSGTTLSAKNGNLCFSNGDSEYRYVVESGELIENGPFDHLEPYFDIDINRKDFTIVDKRTGTEKIVNSQTMADSGYADVFSGMTYRPDACSQKWDTIVLAYLIKVSANYGFDDFGGENYYACFTYDFETERLTFDSLICSGYIDVIWLSYGG